MTSVFVEKSREDFAVLKTKSNDQVTLSFDKIDIDSMDMNEKNIVILCGNNAKSQRTAERYAYHCNNWLKITKFKKDTTMYSVYYPSVAPLFEENNVRPLDYRKFAEEMFNMFIYNNGEVNSVDNIKEKLGNTIFFGHSAGGFVMNQLMKNFGDMLQEADFSRTEIREIFGSVAFIAYAPYILTKAPIKSVYIAPVYDGMGSVKLVYKKLVKDNDFTSSKPINIFGENKITAKGRVQFLRKYVEEMKNENVLYFLNNNSLFSTPSLLYSDGEEEDHNFAGIVNYSTKNGYQTQAGRLTAKFISNAFEYYLAQDRENTSLNDLYRQAIKSMNDESINIK